MGKSKAHLEAESVSLREELTQLRRDVTAKDTELARLQESAGHHDYPYMFIFIYISRY